jgi:hypothetical protein
MLTLLTWTALAACTAADGPPEDPGFPLRMSLEEAAVPERKEQGRENELIFGAALRLTFPGGDVVSGTGALKYGDLFSTGVGVAFHGDYLWRLSRSVLFGAYLEVDYDTFAGASSTDSFGTTLKSGNMNTPRVMVGAKVREEFGRGGAFFSEQFMGFGAIFYPSVQGTLSGATTGSGELFAQKTSFAFDLGFNIGWDMNEHLGLVLGFELEVNGGPGQGKDLVIVSSGSSTPQTMVNAGITLGLNVRF